MAINPAGIAITALAVDTDAGKLYWASSPTNEITSMDLQSEVTETVLGLVDGPIADMAVDTVAGKIYMLTAGASHEISRANLDGTGLETLYSADPLEQIAAIALDTGSGKVYWSESAGGEYKIRL